MLTFVFIQNRFNRFNDLLTPAKKAEFQHLLIEALRDERAAGEQQGRAAAILEFSHNIGSLFRDIEATGLPLASLQYARNFEVVGFGNLSTAAPLQPPLEPAMHHPARQHPAPPLVSPRPSKMQRRSGIKVIERSHKMNATKKLTLWAQHADVDPSDYVEKDRIYLLRHKAIGKCFKVHCGNSVDVFEAKHGKKWNAEKLRAPNGLHGCQDCGMDNTEDEG